MLALNLTQGGALHTLSFRVLEIELFSAWNPVSLLRIGLWYAGYCGQCTVERMVSGPGTGSGCHGATHPRGCVQAASG